MKTEPPNQPEPSARYVTHYDDGGDDPRWVTRVEHGPFVAYNYVEHAADLLTAQLNELASARAESAELRRDKERLREVLEHMLLAAENADETGYVTDAGFVDLEEIYASARKALADTAKPVAPTQPECPDCGGQGWWAKYPANGDPPEQIQCEKCYGTGAIDAASAPKQAGEKGKP